MWSVRGWALPHARPPVLVACGRGPLPTGCGCGGFGRGDPSPTRQCALLRAGFARCAGGKRAPGGGASCLRVGRLGLGALSRPTARPWGMRPGPATQCLWVRFAGVGARLSLAPSPVPLFGFFVRASRFCGTRWPLLLGACPCAVVVAGGVPLWRAPWPCVGATRLVWSGRFPCSGGLSCRRGAFSHSGGCRPRFYPAAARGTWRLAENRALCACRWPLPRQGRWARSASYPVVAPRWDGPWLVPPASVLGCVRCSGLACVDPVTDASGLPYGPSFDGGLRGCTGAVSSGHRHLAFRVGGRHARVPRVCACACSSWPGREARPRGRVLVRLTLPVAVLSFFFVRLPPSRGCPCLGCFLFVCVFVPSPSFPPPLSHPRCPRLCVLPGPGCPGTSRCAFAPTPPFFSFFLVLFRCPAFLPPCVLQPCSRSPWLSPVTGLGVPLFPRPPVPFFVFFSYLPLPRPVFPFFCFFSFFSPPAPSLRPFVLLLSVPRALALCGCPPPPRRLLFFSRPSPRLHCPVFSVVSGPGSPGPWRFVSARPTRPPSLSLSFFFPFVLCSLFPLVPGVLGALCPCTAWLGLLFSAVCGLVCGVCAVSWGCVLCLVAWCCGLLWAVLCGSRRFAVFFGAVWCWCRAVWCVVVLCRWFWRSRSPVGAASPFPCLCHAVPCCAVLFCAVFCRAWSCRASLCGFLGCVLSWCVVSSCRRVRCVVWGFPAPPPPPADAPCCCCLVRCCGPSICSVLGFGAVLVCCAACRVVCCCLRRFVLVLPCCFVRARWCCVLLPVFAGCSLLGLVARCCFPLACFGAGAPAWPRGLLLC